MTRPAPQRSSNEGAHSLVIKLMNSDTHSCTVSLASFAILALEGKVFFMILLMFAIGRKRSCSLTLPPRSSPSSASPFVAILQAGPVPQLAGPGHQSVKRTSLLVSCSGEVVYRLICLQVHVRGGRNARWHFGGPEGRHEIISQDAQLNVESCRMSLRWRDPAAPASRGKMPPRNIMQKAHTR